MLLELNVKDLALIEEMRLSFSPGFSVLSGETGAGKSILVGALGLIAGGRADSDFVRLGSQEAIVEATFDISQNPQVAELLREASLFEGDQLLIRRHISSQGRSRIYINGKGATVGQLEKIVSHLVDLSGQHDQQLLLHEENHRSLLDETPVISNLLNSYSTLYQRTQDCRQSLEALNKKIQERAERTEFLRFQIEEISKANFKDENEEELLLEEKGRVKNADLLFSVANQGEEILQEGEGALLEKLATLTIQVEKGSSSDATLKEVQELLSQARMALEEALSFFSRYREGLIVTPGRLDEIESRLYLIHRLRQKFGGTLGDVLRKEKEIKEELDSLEHHEERVAAFEKELREIEKELMKSASQLSEVRKKRAVELEKKIQKELSALSMPGVCFRIVVESPAKVSATDCGAWGYDLIRFDMAPNKGEGFRPLAKIASGGELSRILLSIKLILADGNSPTTYIFDEVDTGIGGAVADVVGEKLHQLGQSQQVLCVTHLPQVASHASGHFVIEKGMNDKRTRTLVRTLKQEERVEELARMLGGVQITDKTRAHAREMLRGIKN